MSIRIAVGKGSCGIAAGAQKVYDGLEQALSGSDISLGTVGCIGMCWLEPIVDVYENGRLTERLVHVEPQHTKIIAEAVQSGDHAALAPLRISDDDSSFLTKQTRIALRNCGIIDPESIESAKEAGGGHRMHQGFRPCRTRRRGLPDMVQMERRKAVARR